MAPYLLTPDLDHGDDDFFKFQIFGRPGLILVSTDANAPFDVSLDVRFRIFPRTSALCYHVGAGQSGELEFAQGRAY